MTTKLGCILVATSIYDTDDVKAELKVVREKIVSVEWCNIQNKTIEETFYNDKVVIKVTTENLDGKEITISILEDKINKKVADWDKATDSDVVLKATVDNNAATIKFTPKDEWFSKGAKDKQIKVSVSYDKESKISSVFKVKRINYNKDMTLSDNGIRFTAHFEALAMICPDGKIRAYQDRGCGKGKWTVGFGEAETGDKTITKDTVIENETEAWNRFVTKIKGDYIKTVRANLRDQGVKRKLKQYEFDALVDFTYNRGNCINTAIKIAKEIGITVSDFQYPDANRNEPAYRLFSGQLKEIKGHNKLYRKDNTNGGYCNITKQVQETKTVTKNGKSVKEPVFDIVDGKQVPKMKTVEEKGWYQVNSKETHTLAY